MVQALRAQGLSYRDILQQVAVSKSSVSLWCRTVQLDDDKRQALLTRKLAAGRQGLAIITARRKSGTLKGSTGNGDRARCPSSCTHDQAMIERVKRLYEEQRFGVREVAAQLGMSFWRVYDLMRNHGLTRRRGSEQNYATYKTKPQFVVSPRLDADGVQLRAIGTLLYRAEGTKTGHTVDFTNSDPLLIQVFLAFLRRVCGVAEARLRVLLYCYADQDVNRLQQFWSDVTGISLEQFTKPFVRALTVNLNHRTMRWGLVHIRYADARLLQLILQWSVESGRIWAGT